MRTKGQRSNENVTCTGRSPWVPRISGSPFVSCDYGESDREPVAVLRARHGLVRRCRGNHPRLVAKRSVTVLSESALTRNARYAPAMRGREHRMHSADWYGGRWRRRDSREGNQNSRPGGRSNYFSSIRRCRRFGGGDVLLHACPVRPSQRSLGIDDGFACRSSGLYKSSNPVFSPRAEPLGS
jgi:hypothetical protein